MGKKGRKIAEKQAIVGEKLKNMEETNLKWQKPNKKHRKTMR